ARPPRERPPGRAQPVVVDGVDVVVGLYPHVATCPGTRRQPVTRPTAQLARSSALPLTARPSTNIAATTIPTRVMACRYSPLFANRSMPAATTRISRLMTLFLRKFSRPVVLTP